jgi:MYXO-CTERM domain-containing protein
MLEPNGDAFTVRTEVAGLSSYQTHSAICSGRMGESGNVGVGVISASPSGVGRPMFMTVSADTSAFRFERKKEWPIGFYGDSGHLANWYGANPMKQGRDFLQCIGDVPNLGYHKQNGFMADVETFFIAAHAGRVPGNMKNTLDLSIIPGKQDREAAPQNPKSATDVPLGQTDPTETPKAAAPKSESGCACSTPGSTSSTNAGGLAMLALGLGVLVTRRKKS